MTYRSLWSVRRVFLTTLLAVLVYGGSALARSGPKVVLVTASPQEPLVQRLRAELHALAMNVVVVEAEAGSEDGTPEELEDTARRLGAFAAVRAVPLEKSIQIWIADRATGKTLVREVVMPTSNRENQDEVVAVSAVELLRASLMEVHVVERGKPRSGEVTATPGIARLAYRQPAAKPHVAWWLRIGAGMDAGLGGTGIAGHVRLGLVWQPLSRWRAQGWLSKSLIDPRLEDERGHARFGSTTLGISGGHIATIGRWEPRLAAGVAFVRVTSSGSARAGYVGAEEQVDTLAGVVELGTGWSLGHGWRLGLDTTLLLTVRQPTISFADEHLASWGRPAWLTILSVDIPLLGASPAES